MDEKPSQPAVPNWNLPLALLAFALAIFIFAQVWSGGAETQGIEFQTGALGEAKTRLSELIEKNTKELEERKPLVAQSENLQQQFKDDTDKVKKLSTSAAQFEALHKQINDMNKTLEDRKAQVAQSEAVQKQFSDLITAVDQLSQAGDADATLILKEAKAALGLQINANNAPKAEDKKPEGAKPEDKKPEAPKVP